MFINKLTAANSSNTYNTSFKGNPSIDALEAAVNKAKQAADSFKTIIPKKEESKIMGKIKNLLNKIANSKWFNSLADKEGMLAYLVVLGNTAKEIMGTAIYTVQALTNEDLPPDKRKFVGMYDLAVGVVSTTISLVAGLAMVKGQTALVKAIVGKNSTGLPKYAKAIEGITFVLPVALQTIIGKRIIAPAVATPLAGELKRKMEAKEAAKKGTKTENTVNQSSINLTSTQINKEVSKFKERYGVKV